MDKHKLELARKIHGSDLAGPDSFSASQWAGVERAWAWVCENYEPRTEPVFLNEWMARQLKALGITQPPQDQPMKQEQNQPWTDEQLEAARDLYPTELRDECANDLCKEIARVAPLFVEPRAVVKVNRHYIDIGLDVDVVGLDASSMHTEMIPWSEIDRCRTPRAAPSIEAIMQTYWLARSAHQSADEPEREAVREVRDMLVRALCIGEQGDGAVSVIGNTHGRSVVAGSSPAAPSPAPAAPTVADLAEAWYEEGTKVHEDRAYIRQTSSHRPMRFSAKFWAQMSAVRALLVQGDTTEFAPNGDRLTCAACDVRLPKPSTEPFGMCDKCVEDARRPAPAAPFAPDREALANRLSSSGAEFSSEFADEAFAYFAPLLAERDALRKELAERCDQVDSLQHERDKIMVRLGNACQPHEIEDRIRILQQRAGERDTALAHHESRRPKP